MPFAEHAAKVVGGRYREQPTNIFHVADRHELRHEQPRVGERRFGDCHQTYYLAIVREWESSVSLL